MISRYLFILFLSTKIFSQALTGTVFDNTTKKALELVNITFLNKNIGTYTTKEGKYKIMIADTTEVLLISSLGYKTETVLLSSLDLKRNPILDIFLNPKSEELEEVVIQSTKLKYTSTKTLGLHKNLKVRTGFPFGYEFSNYIENPYHKEGKLKSVIISINRKKIYDYLANYNIKFYEYDPITKRPGKEIYLQNLYVEPENKTYKLKIDVEKYLIDFPVNGICIGVEILNKKYPHLNNQMDKIAPSINFTHTDQKVLTWTRYRNKEWKIGTSKSQVKNNFVNAMINIEVLMQ